MAAYIAAYRIQKKRARNRVSRKILMDLQNPFHQEEATFKKKFGLNQDGVHYLCKLIRPVLKRNQGYPVEIQILTSLQVMKSGCYQVRVGEDQIFGVSQATVSRSLDAFVDAIQEIAPNIIEFPSPAELAFTEQKYYGQSRIPNIIGVIDCIHILIQKPRIDDYSLYLNSKKLFSLNVQLVCDSDLYILDAVVHWPGATTNSLIWKESSLRNVLKDDVMPSKMFLLGNNSFPLEPWLLVPYEDCHRSEELIFNDHVERALTVIQACQATLRSRFKCIHHKSGPLFYTPEKCYKIVTACIVLHNICVRMGISLSEPIDLDEDILEMPYTEFVWDEETMMRNEAMCIRDEVAKQLLKS